MAFALAPKCVLCGLAYFGLGTLLGLTGPELCGSDSTSIAPWIDWVIWSGIALGLVAVIGLRKRSGSSDENAAPEIQTGSPG